MTDQLEAPLHASFLSVFSIRMSSEIDKLAEALALAQADIKPATKNRVNPHFKSSFADLEACLASCRPHLSKNGLSLSQMPSANGKRVNVVTLLMHKSGQWLAADLPLEARDASPQAVGSATTYGRRYSLGIVGVTSEEDDDGNLASTNPPRRAAPAEPERFDKNDPAHIERLKRRVQPAHLEYVAEAMDGRFITAENLAAAAKKAAELAIEG